MGTWETANEIIIQGDPDRIYAVAAAVEEWPAFLPHYRWVRVHGREGNRRTVEMAAWRPLIPWSSISARVESERRRSRGLPVRWISHQWLWPEERRITFRHIGGLSRGMEVEWRIEPVEASVVRRQALVESPGGSRAADSGLAAEPRQLTPDASRLTPPPIRVSITHELRLEVPVVRSRMGQWIVGELFVKAVAGRTLACLKQRIEGEP
jgi:ribosome-associated toxin RatA of RatAB toxin-antitoxin module